MARLPMDYGEHRSVGSLIPAACMYHTYNGLEYIETRRIMKSVQGIQKRIPKRLKER